MAKFNVLDKKTSMSLEEIIKFQILAYCYIHKIAISESDLNCLTLLAFNKKTDLSDFCNACCDPEYRDKESKLSYQKAIFKTPQTVRNCITKMKNHNIVSREGVGHNKIIELNPEIKMQTEGNILLNFKIFYLGT